MCPSWDEYRRRYRAFWLALVLTPLWVILGAVIRGFLIAGGMNVELAGLLTCTLPLVPLAVAHIRRILCACPGCGRPFHCTWLYGRMFNRRCIHCGLPKWTPASKEKAPLDLLEI